MDLQRLDSILAAVSAQRRLPPPHSRRLIREGSGVTQRQLGDVLGVHGATVTRWEAGEEAPNAVNAGKYLQALEHLAGAAGLEHLLADEARDHAGA